MSEYQAVLFDMDGVTVATANAWRELEAEEILPAAGEGIDIETIRALSPEDSYERLESMDEVTLRVDRDEFVGLYDEYAEEVYLERATLLDGYEPLLADLRDEELALGLVSASCRDWVALVLERFDLGDAYDVVVSSTDIDGPSKPNPTPYLVAAEQIGVIRNSVSSSRIPLTGSPPRQLLGRTALHSVARAIKRLTSRPPMQSSRIQRS